MSEWVTHVLVAYAVFTILSWYVAWLDQKWVAVGMIGSILPDLSRLDLVIPSDVVAYFIGLDFTWDGIHTIIGILLLSMIGAFLFSDSLDQYRAFICLMLGGISHIIIDLPQRYADGRMILDSYMAPFSVPRPMTPGWYVTPNRWVAAVAIVMALLIFVADRYK